MSNGDKELRDEIIEEFDIALAVEAQDCVDKGCGYYQHGIWRARKILAALKERAAPQDSDSARAGPVKAELEPAVAAPLSATERYMRAYYHEFTPTGCDAVDAILEAVARAGKAFHNTSEWSEPVDLEGPCYWDKIQEAADSAARAQPSSIEATQPETAGSWEERCAVLYQVIGSLADFARVFETSDDVSAALDVACGRGDVEKLLPWPKDVTHGKAASASETATGETPRTDAEEAEHINDPNLRYTMPSVLRDGYRAPSTWAKK